MNAQTRVKAKRAAQIVHELYGLLDELGKELSNSENFAGYLHVRDVHDYLFGRKSTVEVLAKIDAVATMGEKRNG